MTQGMRVAIVGATGAVGRAMLHTLEERKFPVREVGLFASERSLGKVLHFHGAPVRVQALAPGSLAGYDLALFSAGAAVSREHGRVAARAGTVVVDNSSAWRMEPDVPLVVPEVNPQALDRHGGLIANPNCSTIQLVVVLKPLHDAARIRRAVVASYQACSGAGARAMMELEDETRSILLDDRMFQRKVFPRQIAFNVIPYIKEEEDKIVRETRKILGVPDLRITATCARVPVRNGHSEAVNVEFESSLAPERAMATLRGAPGVVVYEGAEYPTAAEVSGRLDVHVGRIRPDPSVTNGLNLWIVADNLLKGAAWNAVQIAETLRAKGWNGRSS